MDFFLLFSLAGDTSTTCGYLWIAEIPKNRSWKSRIAGISPGFREEHPGTGSGTGSGPGGASRPFLEFQELSIG